MLLTPFGLNQPDKNPAVRVLSGIALTPSLATSPRIPDGSTRSVICIAISASVIVSKSGAPVGIPIVIASINPYPARCAIGSAGPGWNAGLYCSSPQRHEVGSKKLRPISATAPPAPLRKFPVNTPPLDGKDELGT